MFFLVQWRKYYVHATLLLCNFLFDYYHHILLTKIITIIFSITSKFIIKYLIYIFKMKVFKTLY